MKLFFTISIFFCLLLIQDQGNASARASRLTHVRLTHKTCSGSATITAPQNNLLFDELSWCDDDNDDDEFISIKKKYLANLAHNKNSEFLLYDRFTYVTAHNLLNSIHSLPGADKCIFQRTIRV